MKLRPVHVIMALTMVCLLATSALSQSIHKGGLDAPHGWMPLAGDLTKEELNNMTLAQIKELREKKMQERNNTTCAELRNMRGMQSPMMHGPREGCHGNMDHNAMWLDPLLLMDDLSKQDLENMTLNQIKELREKKMQELCNKTKCDCPAAGCQMRGYK